MFACVFLNRFNGYWYCSVGRNVVEMVTYTFAFWIFEYLIAKMRSWMPRRAWALNLIYAATFCIGPSSIYSHFIYSVFAFGAAVVSLCSIELLLMHLINCLCQEREKVTGNMFRNQIGTNVYCERFAFWSVMFQMFKFPWFMSHTDVFKWPIFVCQINENVFECSIENCRWKIPPYSAIGKNLNSANVWNTNETMGDTARERVIFVSSQTESDRENELGSFGWEFEANVLAGKCERWERESEQ